MNPDIVVKQLEGEWENPKGFLGKLRIGIFEKAESERLEKILKSINLGEQKYIDRRLVALTWYIPMFMTWQIERVHEQSGNVRELEIAINKIQGLLEDILDVP
jgi:hypothetical protein